MDAQAYLIRHGWSGPGNPLNPNRRPGPHGGLGLTRPILVSRKQNNHGVGKKTTKDPTNQWWLRGFEDALKGIGEEKPEIKPANNALTSELYRHFVRGECLAGTIEKKVAMEAVVTKVRSSSKRKRDTEDEGERRARKEAKAARKEEKAARKEKRAARREEKAKRRKLKEASGSAVTSSGDSSASEERMESKEERRLRKKEKKERKERKAEEKKLKQSRRTASEEDYPTPMLTDEDGGEDTATSASSDEAEILAKKKEKKESKGSKSKSRAKESGEEKDSDLKSSKKEKKDKKAKLV